MAGLTHDDSRTLWDLLQTEYAAAHPTCGECGNAFDNGAGIWIGKVHDLCREGASFETAWARVQREIQMTEGRYQPPATLICPPKRTRTALSYYTALTDPRVPAAEFATRLCDAGVTGTRIWLLDAWAVSAQGGPGCYDGYLPWERDSQGVFDLDQVSVAYLDRLVAMVGALNAHGIVPLLSGLELYTWSDRKQGMLWVPDAEHGPFRRNRQGVRYASDTAFTQIATGGVHGFLAAWYAAMVHALAGLSWRVELGNEMPEKELHYRLREAWRQAGYTGPISVNRHEDTPGQYANMKIGHDFDQIALHGKRDMHYLDEWYDREPVHRTFRYLYGSNTVDMARLTLSSDGCRKSTSPEDAYDYPALAAVFEDVLARGGGIEHQSRMKLRGFTEGRITLDDLEVDWLAGLRHPGV